MPNNEKIRSVGKVIDSRVIVKSGCSKTPGGGVFDETTPISELFFIFSRDILLVINQDDGKIIEANPAAEIIYGYSKEELVNKYIFDLRMEQEAQVTADQMGRAAENGVIFETFHRRKDGSLLPVEVSSRGGRFEDKLVLFSIVRDVTERKKAQDLQRQLEEELERDFAVAKKIQQGFLPPPLENEWLTVRMIFEPCRKVSGDIFDYEWDEENLVLSGLVSDVMGHGLGAALQTSALKVLFRQISSNALSPAQKLQWLNSKIMPYLSEDSLIAAICFELDLRKKTLRCAAGGITEYLVLAGGETSIRQIPGSLLGVTDFPEFEEMRIPVSSGESFFFMTDGLMDLITEVPGNMKYSDATEFLVNLSRNNRLHDDATAICINLSKSFDR